MTARCPICGDTVRVRDDSTLYVHFGTFHRCAGSRTPVAGHTHHCDCGARWDEDA